MNSECQLLVNKKLVNITKMELDIVIDEKFRDYKLKYVLLNRYMYSLVRESNHGNLRLIENNKQIIRSLKQIFALGIYN